jgi:hypothetical protein
MSGTWIKAGNICAPGKLGNKRFPGKSGAIPE